MKPLHPTPRSAFFAAIRDFIPMIFGLFPFGLVFGVAATEFGLTPFEGVGMSAIVLAGAAQLVTIELLKSGAATWVIVLSAVMVNLRFMIYSASLSSYFKALPMPMKLLCAYFITDQPYAQSISYFVEHPDAPYKHWYYLGNGISLWMVWIVSSIVGLLVGSIIPASWSLSFVIPLMFLGLVVPAIKDRIHLASAVVAGTLAVVASPLPNNLGLIVAIVCGLATGVILEQKR